MTDAALTTYRVVRRCTVRSAPSGQAQQLARLDPPKAVRGWEPTPGWIEWLVDDMIMGYIRAGALRELV